MERDRPLARSANRRLPARITALVVTISIADGAGWGFLALMFASGLGLPIPAPPLLIAAGVLAGSGQVRLAPLLTGSVLVLLVADLAWYQLGRWQGSRILRVLCRISLEPESCVQRTEDLFSRHQTLALLTSKFLPGLKAIAPPLAGMLGIPLLEFAAYDAIGAIAWAGAFIGIGYAFSEQVARVAGPLALVGQGLFAAAVAGLVAWIAWKEIARRRFLRRLHIARITPQELLGLLDQKDSVVVVDLRGVASAGAGGEKVRGAVRMDPAELERRYGELTRERDLVIYCDCPNEAAAAQMALRLRERGVTRVRPLLGGIEAWRELGYPTEPLQAS